MFGKTKKDEMPMLTEIVSQAFSAQDARIRIQEEKIRALTEENKKLKEANEQFWDILKKIDDKLSVVYGEVFGARGSDVSIADWKYGEDSK